MKLYIIFIKKNIIIEYDIKFIKAAVSTNTAAFINSSHHYLIQL